MTEISPVVRTVQATRYVTPLREGGSLPAIVEADDLGTYVLKFRGAGQGEPVLVAELIAGELGRALGLPVPDIVFVELDPALGRSEPDEEIQDLMRASAGLNLALDYLPGSLAYDPVLSPPPDQELATRIVWFDALITNVDRTARNTNMLIWHKSLWLIDHGAALYFHHSWKNYLQKSTTPFPQIRDHVLLPLVDDLRAIDQRFTDRLDEGLIRHVVNLVPDTWLRADAGFDAPEEHREAYVAWLMARLQEPRRWVEEAQHAAELL